MDLSLENLNIKMDHEILSPNLDILNSVKETLTPTPCYKLGDELDFVQIPEQSLKGRQGFTGSTGIQGLTGGTGFTGIQGRLDAKNYTRTQGTKYVEEIEGIKVTCRVGKPRPRPGDNFFS